MGGAYPGETAVNGRRDQYCNRSTAAGELQAQTHHTSAVKTRSSNVQVVFSTSRGQWRPHAALCNGRLDWKLSEVSKVSEENWTNSCMSRGENSVNCVSLL